MYLELFTILYSADTCEFLHVVQAAELTSEEKEVMELNILGNA